MNLSIHPSKIGILTQVFPNKMPHVLYTDGIFFLNNNQILNIELPNTSYVVFHHLEYFGLLMYDELYFHTLFKALNGVIERLFGLAITSYICQHQIPYLMNLEYKYRPLNNNYIFAP